MIGITFDAKVIKLLRGEVEDGPLVILLRRGKVQRPARADVEGKPLCDAPVVLGEVFLDVIARAKLRSLQVDLESIDLTQQEARERVAAVGNALLIRSGSRKCEGTGGVGGRNSIELIPAEVDSCFEVVRPARVDDRVE